MMMMMMMMMLKSWWNDEQGERETPNNGVPKKGEPFRRNTSDTIGIIECQQNMRLCLQVGYCKLPKALSSSILCIILFDMVVSEHGVSLTKAQFHARFSRKNYDEALISGISYSQTNLQIV